jgi:hypothetical protein
VADVTVMLAEPLERLAVGVKVAVLVSPVPLIAPSVPPEMVRSPVVPFQAKLVPGSSEKVNVMSAVSPTFSAAIFEVIATLGASVSIVIEGVVPAEPMFPEVSV